MLCVLCSVAVALPALAAEGFSKKFDTNASTFLGKIFGFDGSTTDAMTKFPGPLGIISYVITIVLAFVGTIFLILIIYGGIQWMTAQGNEEKVTKAQTIIKDSVIGLAVVLFAYLITYTIVSRFLSVSGGTGP